MLHTSIDQDILQSSLASTGNGVNRALDNLAYSIETGSGHHGSKQIAGDILPLPAQPLSPSPALDFEQSSWRPLPPEEPSHTRQPAPRSSLSDPAAQSDTRALGKRRRHTRSEMTGERPKRSPHMTPAGSQSSEYRLESRNSIFSTKQTTPLSGMSIHQDATDLTRQELASSKGVDCHGPSGGSARPRSMTCKGKIGICLPEQFQSARPFNKNERLMAEFLSQAVSGKSLGWHIYWITPAAFTVKVLAKSSDLSRISYYQRRQLHQFLVYFGRHNCDIHQNGVCSIEKQQIDNERGCQAHIKRHRIDPTVEKRLSQLTEEAKAILEDCGIPWRTYSFKDEFATSNDSDHQLSLIPYSQFLTSEALKDQLSEPADTACTVRDLLSTQYSE
jgi:hypothetical protein